MRTTYRGVRALRDRYADAVRTGFPDIPRLVSVFNLDALLPESGFDLAKALVGTESTCVTVLRVTPLRRGGVVRALR